jgi:S-DNA-T family DNA segregation ATPase FtsK/SpoIIIE
VLDVPEQQRTRELHWSPARHGHLGLVGGGADTDAALSLTVDQLLSAEQETHLYLLDAAGSFNGMQPSARVGTRVGPDELRRAARVLERLAEEMAGRLRSRTAELPELVLVLAGWGTWVSGFRAGPLAWAEDLVYDIVRDGAGAGITVVASGQRELVTARFFAAVPNRAFFPAGSTVEGRLAWPLLPLTEPLPGRLVAFGPFAEATTSAAGHTGQLFEPPGPGVRDSPRPESQRRPFRIEQLPARVTISEMLSRSALVPPAPPGRRSLCLGIGGDELLPVCIQLPAAGLLAILGAPGSGKSTALSTLQALNSGVCWIRPPAGADPGAYWSQVKDRALAGRLAG